MSRKRRYEPKRDLAREQAVLSTPVRSDGVGEAPAVQAVLSDSFLEMSNLDALNVALALQELIKGQNSLLANQERYNAEIEKLKV
jgi:hypothetical protein